MFSLPRCPSRTNSAHTPSRRIPVALSEDMPIGFARRDGSPFLLENFHTQDLLLSDADKQEEGNKARDLVGSCQDMPSF